MNSLREVGLEVRDDPAVEETFAELRALYEPFVTTLASYFQFTVPPFLPMTPPIDNWQTSAWTRRAAGLGDLPAAGGALTPPFSDVH